MKRIIAILSFLISGLACSAQVSISGYQERIPYSNARLRCDGLNIVRSMRIDSVSGFHNGFWIVRGAKTEKAFWSEKYVPDARGYVLRPGTYYVYPNLRADSDTASVTIWLKRN